MSTQCLIAKCKDCQKKYEESCKDPNNPFGDDDSDFCVVLEWLSKDEILKKVKEYKCPDCGSDNWYLTDVSEH